jgi:hypothetical protein
LQRGAASAPKTLVMGRQKKRAEDDRLVADASTHTNRALGNLEPPRHAFWLMLVYVPAAVATMCALGAGVRAFPEAYLITCFTLASAQMPFARWWRENVEGDVGMPRFVHAAAGLAEIAVVMFRLLSASDDLVGLAHCITCGLMGGGCMTWLHLVRKPVCSLPAALVLAASLLASPYDMRVHLCAAVAFCSGAVSALLVWRLQGRLDSTYTQ